MDPQVALTVVVVNGSRAKRDDGVGDGESVSSVFILGGEAVVVNILGLGLGFSDGIESLVRVQADDGENGEERCGDTQEDEGENDAGGSDRGMCGKMIDACFTKGENRTVLDDLLF